MLSLVLIVMMMASNQILKILTLDQIPTRLIQIQQRLIQTQTSRAAQEIRLDQKRLDRDSLEYNNNFETTTCIIFSKIFK